MPVLPSISSAEPSTGPATWARLDKMRVGRWGEQFVAMALTKEGLDVYLPAVDDRSIDMLVRQPGDPARYLELQVKTIRLAAQEYVFMRKRLFPISPSRYLALVVLTEGEAEPNLFLVPSFAWAQPERPFVSRDFGPGRKSEPEYGLTVRRAELGMLESYRFDQQLRAIRSAR